MPHAGQVAGLRFTLDVTEHVLQVRLEHLHPAERATVRAALLAAEHAA